MKKFYLIILMVLFTFSFVSCDKTTTETTVTTKASTETTEVPESSTETTVITLADLEPVFAGVETITMTEGETFSIGTITASDNEDGDLTDDIQADLTNLDADTIGSYTVELSVTDSYGHEVTVSVTVEVERQLTAEEKVNKALNNVVLEYTDGQTEIDFPRFDRETGTFFYWKSTNTHVVTSSGYVIKPHVGSENVVITITCKANNAGTIVEKNFTLTILANQEVAVTSQAQIDFVGTSEEYIVEDKTALDVFYVDDGAVPYMDIESFINMVDGAIEAEELTYTPVGDDQLLLSYTVTFLDWDEVTEVTEDYTCLIDFTENTVTFNSYDFMGSYVGSTESDYGSGLLYTGASYVEGGEFVINLGDYNFDLLTYTSGESTYYLMPLVIENLLFLGEVYYNVYYNGDTIYGVDTFVLSDGDETIMNQIRTSSYNTEDMPDDLKLATYNFLALAFDNFYGLKEFKGVDTYYEILDSKVERIMTSGDYSLYNDVFGFAYGRDDLHTWHQFTGYYEEPYDKNASISDLGSQSTAYYENYWDIQDKIEEKYGSIDAMPKSELLDNDTVCVIHITGFTIDTPDEFKAILDALPATVEDVVIDLSYNGGGNLGAVLRIWGYMTEETFMYHSQNPADGSASTYFIESEYVAYDYNWYVLSSGVTFSAANLFTSMAKEMGVPVLGQNSSGGASSIGVIVSPDGSGLFVSTNNVLSTRVGNEIDGYDYLSIEDGIQVDYSMSNVMSNEQLLDIINQIRALQTA